MLLFVKNDKIIRKDVLNTTDPLTLCSYKEELFKKESPIFSMLICETSRFVYLSEDIIEMRYSIDGRINVYLVKDPISREIVTDIWYFELENNPLYRNEEYEKWDDQNDILCTFVSNEIALLYNKDLQKKILSFVDEDISITIQIFFSFLSFLIIIILLYTLGFLINKFNKKF